MYRQLEPDKIVETVEALCTRIAARFPGSGLGQVGRELLAIGHEAKGRAAWFAKPKPLLRAATAALLPDQIWSFSIPNTLKLSDDFSCLLHRLS